MAIILVFDFSGAMLGNFAIPAFSEVTDDGTQALGT